MFKVKFWFCCFQPSSGYYDPASQYAATSLAAAGSRNDGSSNLVSYTVFLKKLFVVAMKQVSLFLI